MQDEQPQSGAGDQAEGQTPTVDPKADHDANHQDKKVEGCEFC